MIDNSMSWQSESLTEYVAAKTMRKTYSRFGWALFALFGVWYGLIIAVGLVFGGLEAFGYPAMPFYERYMLVFNELGLAFGIVAAMLVLKPFPKYELKTEKISFLRFLKYFVIGITIGAVGNLIGTALLAVWNGATGNEAGGEVTEILMGSDSIILFLMVGLAAPFLEEFLFRKLFIDYTHQFGDLPCILTSGVLFGLFHGNFTQFFYAFGLGALLAYLYLKSGSFLLVFIFHAVFNVFSGILPMLLMESDVEMAYLSYTYIYMILMLLGVVLLVASIGGIKLRKGYVKISRKKCVSAVLLNTGMAAAWLVMIAMMLLSLFAA